MSVFEINTECSMDLGFTLQQVNCDMDTQCKHNNLGGRVSGGGETKDEEMWYLDNDNIVQQLALTWFEHYLNNKTQNEVSNWPGEFHHSLMLQSSNLTSQ
jgi:hypothetical protein